MLEVCRVRSFGDGGKWYGGLWGVFNTCRYRFWDSENVVT